MAKAEIKSLFYITHIDNLPSILSHGILSHGYVEANNVPFTAIYDADIVSNRKNKATPDENSLWAYANVYFQPRNPMMYRVVKEKTTAAIAVIGVTPSVIRQERVLITDGNAANNPTRFYRRDEGLKMIDGQWRDIQREYWKEVDGSKRKIMAECLIPEKIAPEYIHSIFVADHDTQAVAAKLIGSSRVPVIPEPNFFFRPWYKSQIGANISLVEGDMFFSGMQTLTVSVNTQGIMGKGLASRAKYQFPDVYVNYQDACRSKKLTATKPYIYKRESSLDQELADLTTPLQTPNAVKWFLLFATKRRWQENSRLDDIEAGLDWFRRNFKLQGVQSVAMPALGCGLGGLDWAEVGPLMCRYLHDIGIKVAIYLPRERGIDPRLLTPQYLLGAQQVQ